MEIKRCLGYLLRIVGDEVDDITSTAFDASEHERFLVNEGHQPGLHLQTDSKTLRNELLDRDLK